MMKHIKPLLLLAVPALVSCVCLVNEHPTSKASSSSSEESTSSIDYQTNYNVLFIGNSFTFYNDLDAMANNLAQSVGLTNFHAERVAASSYRLSQHADGNDEVGKQVEEKLKNNHYTHIIMQEQSTLPVSNYNNFLAGATALYNKIKTYQSDAKVSLYETWGFNNMVGNYGSSIPECEANLYNAYRNCARALNVDVHYVGRAFTKSYQEQPAINLYHTDDKHPSFKGTYLSGLIHLASITGVDVRTATYQGTPGSTNAYGETYINDEESASLKDIAYSIYNQYGTNY